MGRTTPSQNTKPRRCRRLSGHLLHLALDLLFCVDVASVGLVAIDRHPDSPNDDRDDRVEEALRGPGEGV